jgi:hypothetical protein
VSQIQRPTRHRQNTAFFSNIKRAALAIKKWGRFGKIIFILKK